MINGTLYSKFVYDNAGTPETVLLQHSIIEPEYYVPEQIKHTSIINGDNNFVNATHHSSFIITVHLFKYADPLAKYSEIVQSKDSLVTFYPHADGNYITDDYNVAAPFRIKKIVPYCIENMDRYDAVKIYFESTKHTNLIVQLTDYGFDYGEDYGEGL